MREIRMLRSTKLKKRTALLAKLKDVFRRHQSQPVDRVIKLINPVLRGWVNYFRAGHPPGGGAARIVCTPTSVGPRDRRRQRPLGR